MQWSESNGVLSVLVRHRCRDRVVKGPERVAKVGVERSIKTSETQHSTH